MEKITMIRGKKYYIFNRDIPLIDWIIETKYLSDKNPIVLNLSVTGFLYWKKVKATYLIEEHNL